MNPTSTSTPKLPPLARRTFIKGVLAGAGMLATAPELVAAKLNSADASQTKPSYRGPNVIIIRFGGGARRKETIDPSLTYSPFLCHELTKRGTLFKNMEISSFVKMEGRDNKGKPVEIETSHGQGTLYIMTGKYDRFRDVGGKFLGERFESTVPTVFEYLRKSYEIPEHQTLIVNGEDRTDEEFYSFSNHHLFGAHFRSNVLSLYRFKTYLLRRQLALGKWTDAELKKKKEELAKFEALDYRTNSDDKQGAAIEKFWEHWREYYGETGLVNPRGDRLLTEITTRALRELRPKLIMVNYNDCDYVHWGNMNHYTRAVAIMDEGLRQIVSTVEADEEYRNNTIFVVVPDCGRDSNPFTAVPCQHHFGSRSSHEIFALLFGSGIDRGQVVERPVDQISIASTVGKLMGFNAEFAEGPVLGEAIA